MSVLPSRLLIAVPSNVTPTDYWTVDDGTGDPWLGFPYRWSVDFTVDIQIHSSHLTPTPFQYDATDIQEGDWFADFAAGNAVRVIEITGTPTSGAITCVVEDVDRFNIFNDPMQQGTGINGGQGAFFVLGNDGLPILSPMSQSASVLGQNLAWQMDQQSRFRYRNYLSSHYPVHQPAHGFQVGDLIRLTPTGYVKAQAATLVANIVGSVSATGIPGADWFNFRPVGRIVQNLSPALPGNAGDLVYIDSNGAYTVTKPTAWARPVYIRLDAPTTGIVLDRGVDGTNASGYSSQTYVVATPGARDALAPNLNVGDQVLIKDMGNGEWSHFIFEQSQTFTLLVTQDASDTDSHSKQIVATYLSDPTSPIATISAGRRVDEVVVQVTEAFDGTATLMVGTDADHAQFMSGDQNDLSLVGDYKTEPSSVLDGPNDTTVKYWLSTSGCTKGSVTISITYS
jgi:hypothetical protein